MLKDAVAGLQVAYGIFGEKNVEGMALWCLHAVHDNSSLFYVLSVNSL